MFSKDLCNNSPGSRGEGFAVSRVRTGLGVGVVVGHIVLTRSGRKRGGGGINLNRKNPLWERLRFTSLMDYLLNSI